MKKFIGTVLVIVAICLLYGCSVPLKPDPETTESDTQTVKVTSISITSESNVTEIEEGLTLQLTATVKPDNASNKQVEWHSSDTDCATVNSDGLVTALKATESLVITAKAKDGSNVTGAFNLKIKAAATLPADSILRGLVITDNYNHTITTADCLTLPNNRKGNSTSSIITIKNNGEKSLTFVSSSITNTDVFHTDGNCSLVNNGTSTTFNYRDLKNKELVPGAELNLTLASYTSKLGVNTGKISFDVNDGSETTETLDVKLKIYTTDTYEPLLKLNPETEGTVYVNKTNKGTFNFTLENTAAYLPLNVSAEVNLYKTIPYYSGNTYSIEDICQKIQKITEVQYPTETLDFLHPADTYNFNLSTSNQDEGGFIFEVIFTYDYEDCYGEIIESYKQEPIYYTFYTEPEKEPELVQETFKYKPLGVYGGKAYFYSTDSLRKLCVLNEDNTFTELDASYGYDSLRVGDEIYFNQRIIYSNTEQWLYKLGSNGLEKLASSETGIDFTNAVKCGDVIYYADDRVLHGSGAEDLYKIDLKTNQISQIQTNDDDNPNFKYHVTKILCADSNYLYYDHSYNVYALKLSDESYQKVFDEEGCKPFVYKDKVYMRMRLNDGDKYYIINGTESPDLVENQLTALLLDYGEFKYYTVGDYIVFYKTNINDSSRCVIYDGTTVRSYEYNYIFRDGDSIYWIKKSDSAGDNGYTGKLSYFDGSSVKELDKDLLYLYGYSDKVFKIHQTCGNKKIYYSGYNGSLISFDLTTQNTRAVYFTNNKNVTGSGDPFKDKCNPYIGYGDGLSCNGYFYFTAGGSLYSYREQE